MGKDQLWNLGSTFVGRRAEEKKIHSDFFMVQYSHAYMTTGKTIDLAIWAFVSKVMSLLFNTVFRLAIANFPRNKCLLISWLQSLSTLILEPKKMKMKYDTFSTFSPSFAMNA